MLAFLSKVFGADKEHPTIPSLKIFNRKPREPRHYSNSELTGVDDKHLTEEQQRKKYMLKSCGDFYPELTFVWNEKLGCEVAHGHNVWYRKDGRLALLAYYSSRAHYYVILDYDGETEDSYTGYDIMGKDEDGKFIECVGEEGKAKAMKILLDYVVHDIRAPKCS